MPKAKHKCEKCGKDFRLKRYLTKHELRHQNDKPAGEEEEKMEPLRCSMCDKVFPRLSHLQRHQLTHFNVRDFACDFCDEKFVQKVHLTRHLARKHSGETENGDEITWISCGKCGHLFRTIHELRAHRKSLHLRLRCKRCSSTIEGKEEIRKHEMRCRNRQNLCDQCGASFKRPADLTAHVTSCQNKVQFVCVPCQEFFKQRVQLDRHIKKLHFHPPKCSNCEHISESPIQNARHAMDCRKIIICGYCNHQNPDGNHTADNHWKRLKRAVSVHKARREAKQRVLVKKEVVAKVEEDSDEDSGDSGAEESEDSESDEEVAPEDPPEASPDDEAINSMIVDHFAESTSSQMNFTSSAFADDDEDDEEYLTFSILPDASEPTFYLRGKVPEELKELFPVLEETSIVMLNSCSSSSSSRSRMLIQVPVRIPKNGRIEEEMRKWLKNTIVLD